MIYGSVCSGVEAATLAWKGLGWKAAWFAEIDRFPSAVLAHHYPDVPNLGDMTRLHESGVFNRTAIDLLVGGTPCQSFSVAGLRKGLDDPRGNLTLTYLGLVERARPRWVVWENVPGVLSDDEGRTFGSFLGGLGKLGYGFAYRVLDAQHFGVPQRRRRVFVVGYLGDWRRPAAVLFERHSLSWHPPPRRKAGQEVAGTLSARSEGGGGLGTDFECSGGLVSNTLTTRPGGRQDPSSDTYIAHTLRGEGFDASEDGTGRGTPLVPICFSKGDYGHDAGIDVSPTLRRGGDGGGNMPAITLPVGVRRLMPVECERLQGFPDGYTKIKGASDGAMYKAAGNSMAVPVMAWIGRRIAEVDRVACGT